MEIKGKRQRNINRETESERQAMEKTELNLNKFETGNTVLRSKPLYQGVVVLACSSSSWEMKSISSIRSSRAACAPTTK